MLVHRPIPIPAIVFALVGAALVGWIGASLYHPADRGTKLVTPYAFGDERSEQEPASGGPGAGSAVSVLLFDHCRHVYSWRDIECRTPSELLGKLTGRDVPTTSADINADPIDAANAVAAKGWRLTGVTARTGILDSRCEVIRLYFTRSPQ